MLKVTIKNGLFSKQDEYWDFEAQASEFGRSKARALWRRVVGTDPPKTVEEAYQRFGEFVRSAPQYVEIVRDGKWPHVKDWKEMKYATATARQASA